MSDKINSLKRRDLLNLEVTMQKDSSLKLKKTGKIWNTTIEIDSLNNNYNHKITQKLTTNNNSSQAITL